MNLTQWYSVYAKHKDLIKKSLKTIQETPEGLLLTYKDKKERAICTEQLPAITQSKEHIVYVIENSKKNVDLVIHAWEQLSASPNVKIIFVNVAAQGKWILWPSVHTKIADETNLKEGLLGLSELVPFTDEEITAQQ